MDKDKRIYDLMVVTDATASMGMYLNALNASLPEIIKVSALTGCFSRIGVVAYRDYCGGALTEWSGWHGLDDNADVGVDAATTKKASRQELLDFAKRLSPSHGGDWPEAAKTGLARAYANMRDNVGTVVVFFTDAPPHTPATGGVNRLRETRTLTNCADGADRALYGSEAAAFADWVTLARTLRSGTKQARVFSIVQSHLVDTLAPFAFLSARTGGACFEIPASCGAAVISAVTLGVLLAWMGVEKKETAASASASSSTAAKIAKLCRYRDTTNITSLVNEADTKMETFWVRRDEKAVVKRVADNFDKVDVSVASLKQFVAARKPAVADFSQRYKADAAYRALVTTNLQDIIKTDVAAVTANPVFGSLWRTVCSDRLNEARDQLVALFSQQVEAVTDADKKARLKQWLEESYDHAAEILEMVDSVPAAEQFPCVFLDPTLDFAALAGADGEGEGEDGGDADGPGLTRADLLEIGRSCDARILRRLGRVLARLTYVESAAALPAHIAAKDKDSEQNVLPGESGFVPRIPLALARPEHKRKFWKVLLHTIVPGTMLGPRPAALLAALSLRMGMAPLRDAADRELLAFAGQWNTLDIPETWNTNCLNLLLSADKDYTARAPETAETADGAASAGNSVLSAGDRALFKALVDYKLAEVNLTTTLTARVGWLPDKAHVAMGPTVVCHACHFPRSVTIMSGQGVCGLCDKTTCDCATPQIHAEMVAAHVSADDTASTPLAWVECGVRSCRAQYVVYNEEKLRVRAKCHYCRTRGVKADDATAVTTAPYVECTACLSRVIWPMEYRPAGFDARTYTCPACAAGVATVVDMPTTAAQLVDENGRGWLLRNDGNKIAEPFSNRSLFYTISTAGVDGFAAAVEVLPAAGGGACHGLTLKDKKVRNADAVVAELRRWIASRRAEGENCSLCFSSMGKRRLRAACGRRGCAQRICGDCHAAWYGLNARGKILNVAALSCPFCRRQPAPRVIAGNTGLATLGNLRAAVDNAGTWIYAWCSACGMAKEFAERVCARGAPPEVVDWQCTDCEDAAEAAAAAAAAANNNNDAGEHRAVSALRYRPCPGCGTMTQKISGCDHITCTVTGCGTHWCFFCGEAVHPGGIYEHMSAEHGGWYGGGHVLDYVTDDDMDDDTDYGEE
ncbi:hypothetical protein SCUCBS95973_007114 [Sporothrix curviconia]|uniref:RBR-type E3 ubiquitin transferase n=1 Tax=Sporothrix curviconia TaxID=1260050 RepID=A0ABP0CBV3_9PEZI